MSGEVARAIIKKATHHHDNLVNLEKLGSVNIISNQLENVMKEEINSIRKMIVFDMDNTVLQGRFIDACADKFSFDEKLARLRSTEKDPAVLTKRIAELLRGLSMGELLEVASSIPFVNDTIEVVELLRKRGNVVGIISDSYQFVTDYVKNKLEADFAIGNQLDFFEGKATGEVTIPSYFYYQLESKCDHPLCKTNALRHIGYKYNIALENCIAIGDSASDLCMIEQAGMGIAFCTKNTRLRKAADKIIDQLSFADLLETEQQFTRKKMFELTA